MEWFALIIPFIVAFIGLQFFNHEIHKLEIAIPVVVTIIFIGIFKWAGVSYNVSDTEYWGSKLIRAEYYEEWDEWIEETCSYECCCDSEGNNCQTVYYDCSYRRYHAPKWRIVNEYGNSLRIPQREYKRLVKKFGNEKFQDMNRDFYKIDGDKYVTRWDGSYQKLENVVMSFTYENRPQATKNLFHYEDLTPEEEKGLFDYPPIVLHKQNHLLGLNDPEIRLELERINADLAKKKQIKLFILVFNNQLDYIAFKQESYWKGGNKNEFVVVLNRNGDIFDWCKVISWTENQYAKIETEELFRKNNKVSELLPTIKKLKPILTKNFKRKKFSDFDYIKVPLSNKQLTWLFIITIVVNIGSLVVTVNNQLR